eukprot:gene13865-4810_t
MSSDVCGAQAEVRKEAPNATNTHCRSHIVNLAILAACKNRSTRNMMDVVSSVYLFYEFSPKKKVRKRNPEKSRLRCDGEQAYVVAEPPDSLPDALCVADRDIFHSVRRVLVIGCISPIGSCEAERAASGVRRLKTAYRSTMSSQRESDLNLIQMRSDLLLTSNAVVDAFIKCIQVTRLPIKPRGQKRVFNTIVKRRRTGECPMYRVNFGTEGKDIGESSKRKVDCIKGMVTKQICLVETTPNDEFAKTRKSALKKAELKSDWLKEQ